MSRLARVLLAIDSLGALSVGAVCLLAREPIAALEGHPTAFVAALALANLAYGTYSGVLALRSFQGLVSRRALDLLIVANVSWTPVCLALTLLTSGTVLGRAHLVLEGLYVGALGLAERRFVRPECH